MTEHSQPHLHDHVTCVAAPATWLSPPSGQLAAGADGLYVEDRRVLSALTLTVDGHLPTPLTVRRTGAASAVFASVPRNAPTPPTLTLTRRRLAKPSGGTETITLTNASNTPAEVDVALYAATDFAALGEIRTGTPTAHPLATPPTAKQPSTAAPLAAQPVVAAPLVIQPSIVVPSTAQPSTAPSSSAAPSSVAPSSVAPTSPFTPPSPAARLSPGVLDWHAADGMSVQIQTTPPAAASTLDRTSGAEPLADAGGASREDAPESLRADAVVAAREDAFEPLPADAVGAAREDGLESLRADAGSAPRADASAAVTLRWRVTVPPRGTWSAEIRVTRTDVPPIARPKRFSTLRVAADDRRLDALVRASVQDLDALRRTEGADAYYAAGSPWYLTLFGRDALWTARLALPLGHEVAAGTVRLLAARQGAGHDPATEEQPGRILHEVRRADTGHTLPPVYYGTVDATPLFVSALADAYRWGMPAAAVRPLLPNVRRAMAWLLHHDDFIAHDTAGAGLSNQGWKDSGDAVQHADGRPVAGPIALCEVQAYAYRAALDAAWLVEQFPGAPQPGDVPHADDKTWPLDAARARDRTRTRQEAAARAAAPDHVATPARGEAQAREEAQARGEVKAREEALARDEAQARGEVKGRPHSRDAAQVRDEAQTREEAHADGAGEAQRWREWAHDLADRFRARFWTPGGHPAIALDGAGNQVDLLASNMGHLLGTGLLEPAESAAVAGHLAGLRSPFGIRTVAPASAGYNFLSYHLGSVWPHDNAVALLGLARDGHRAEASAVIAALLDAAERFDFRLPELYGGDDLPTPYPSACRPQAWAAAVGPAILTALLGLEVDVPAGRIVFDPIAPSPVGAYRVRGLKVGGGELDVSVTAAGVLTVHNGPVGVTFRNADGSPARIGRPA
ncbi:glycogen debranching N-terminal domain-containing protein [Dactylosporangium sp. NPDC051485]|uniref:glycogen debranching N-terminal domain-containing protein n=1 Tax=Dactylosporangium sp. NPDC051485 TaxID=3154846 RepID=UPI003435D536